MRRGGCPAGLGAEDCNANNDHKQYLASNEYLCQALTKHLNVFLPISLHARGPYDVGTIAPNLQMRKLIREG